MPRAWNLIQNPELVRHIQRALGMRQAAATPTLAENIQPVIVVGDVSKPSVPAGDPCLAYWERDITAGNLDYSVAIYNPRQSGVIARVTHIELRALNAEHAAVGGFTTQDSYDTAKAGHTPPASSFPGRIYADPRKCGSPPFTPIFANPIRPSVEVRRFQTGVPIVTPDLFVARYQVLALGNPNRPPFTETRTILIPPGFTYEIQNSAPLAVGDGIAVQCMFHEERIELT